MIDNKLVIALVTTLEKALRHPLSDAHEWLNETPHCPYLLCSETTAKGTSLRETAGKTLLQLDSNPTLRARGCVWACVCVVCCVFCVCLCVCVCASGSGGVVDFTLFL